jgi:hypothetical protein
MDTNQLGETHLQTDSTGSVILSISDKAANDANMAAIDQLVGMTRYRHIVAWGKLLGFTPQTVQKSIIQAEAESAPSDAIQKIDGNWFRIGDIANDANQQRVNDLARHAPRLIS